MSKPSFDPAQLSNLLSTPPPTSSPIHPSHALVDAIRAHLSSLQHGRLQPARRHTLAKQVLHILSLMEASNPCDANNHSLVDGDARSLRRSLAETRLICFRMLLGMDKQAFSASLNLINIAPDHPGSYLQCAISFWSSGESYNASVYAWKSLLMLEDNHGKMFEKGVQLLAKCQTVLNFVRLDLVSEAQHNTREGNARRGLLSEPLWLSLSTEQKARHAMLLRTIKTMFYQNSFVMRSPATLHKSPSPSFFRPTPENTDNLQRLPQYFSWVLPFVLAASSEPHRQSDIANLAALGFNKVVTLCMERPLNSHWFSTPITNIFLPMKDMYPPSHAQLDAFFAEATEPTARTIVHCVAGKGRTGTVLAAWAMLYGVEQRPVLCGSCSAMLHKGMRHRLRVGSCKAEGCSLGCRKPAMSAEEAIQHVRSLRSPSVSAGRQQAFLKAYSSELWRRASGSLLENENSGSVFGSAIDEGCSSPLQVLGNCPKRLPSLIVLCGLPGSGKSSFARSISRKLGNRCLVACQDEMGTKAACELAISNSVKDEEKTCSIVDRCNILERDRAEWLGTAFKPKDAVVVFLQTPVETCIARAQGRVDHKTIVPGKAERLIRSMNRSFQTPGERDLARGFDGLLIAKGQPAMSELLALFEIVEGPESLEQLNRACLVSKEASPNRTVNLIKFPRTRHLVDLGATTRDDLHMPPADAKRMLDLHRCDGMEVHLEEKVDGSNIGFSLDRETGAIRVQNRSHFVCESSHPQYRLLPRFIARYEKDLRKVLNNDPNNILYGEWLYARHSVSYTQLPSYFLAFDLYDGRREKFFSRERFADVLKGTELKAVPGIKVTSQECFTLASIVDRVMNGKSCFGGVEMEGIYVRVDQGDWLVERAKVVRPGFIAGNAHWSRRTVEQNSVREGGETYAYNY